MGACGSAAPPAKATIVASAVPPSLLDPESPTKVGNGIGQCTWSCSDKDHGMTWGQEKKAKNMSAIEGSVGVCCRKGLKPARVRTTSNQDAWCVTQAANGKSRLFGVFDGHGDMGHEAADAVKEGLPKLLAKRMAAPAKDAEAKEGCMPPFADSFQAMQSNLKRRKWSDMSGTTATVVVHDVVRNRLQVGHVGDSTAVLGRVSGEGPTRSLKAVPLTRDHRPELIEEQMRIERCGGKVVNDRGNFRVVKRGARYPGLNMSRSLGDDVAHHCGVLAVPEEGEHVVGPDDQLLLLCSDGIWEVIGPQEALEIVAEAGAQQDPQKAAEALATEASSRWFSGTGGTICDDITVLLVNLQADCWSGVPRTDTASTMAPLSPNESNLGFPQGSGANPFAAISEDSTTAPEDSSGASL